MITMKDNVICFFFKVKLIYFLINLNYREIDFGKARINSYIILFAKQMEKEFACFI